MPAWFHPQSLHEDTLTQSRLCKLTRTQHQGFEVAFGLGVGPAPERATHSDGDMCCAALPALTTLLLPLLRSCVDLCSPLAPVPPLAMPQSWAQVIGGLRDLLQDFSSPPSAVQDGVRLAAAADVFTNIAQLRPWIDATMKQLLALPSPSSKRPPPPKPAAAAAPATDWPRWGPSSRWRLQSLVVLPACLLALCQQSSVCCPPPAYLKNATPGRRAHASLLPCLATCRAAVAAHAVQCLVTLMSRALMAAPRHTPASQARP